MGENKFKTFKRFYMLLILIIGVGFSFFLLDETLLGIGILFLALAHHASNTVVNVPYIYTLMIHAYGIFVWVYIHYSVSSLCPNSLFTRLAFFMILSEVWIMFGTVYSKSIRQKGV